MTDIREDYIVPLYFQTVEAIDALVHAEQLTSDRPALECLEDLLKTRSILFPWAFPPLS